MFQKEEHVVDDSGVPVAPPLVTVVDSWTNVQFEAASK